MTRDQQSLNPTAIGWMLGLGVPVVGAFVLGPRLRSALAAVDAPPLVLEAAPVLGALVGLAVLLVGLKLVTTYLGSDDDRPPVSRHFEDDSSRER